MDRLKDKVAVVTGAGSGMGAAITAALNEAGCRVIGLEFVPQYVKDLESKGITVKECNVGNPDEVSAIFKWIEDNYRGVDIMVNNAGVLNQGQITEVGPNVLSEEQIISSIDTNFKGVVLCTRRAIASMRKHNIDGHVINICSIAGHYIAFSPSFNVYPATKHAVKAFSASLLNEIAHFDNKIKVTNICPGLTKTRLFTEEHSDMPSLEPSDIADAVLYVLSTPSHVNISELTIQPVMEKRL